MKSIFLTRGNLRLGLIVGLPVFIALFFVSVGITQMVGSSYGARGISFGYLFSLTPYILVLSLSNGIKDELWFRGLFFKKYQPLLGPRLSNPLQALIFALNGLGAEYQPILIIFAVVSVLLALGVGYLMQKTDSVIGSSLIQAGADTPIFLILILTSVH
jgi:membrane protease YdiL (CAAX protease family)